MIVTEDQRREQIAKIVCCGEHGRCILDDCEPNEGEQTACVALKYDTKTVDALLALPALTALQSDTRAQVIEIIDHELDIEVDRDGLCHWTDVANAVTHIKAQINALIAEQSATMKAFSASEAACYFWPDDTDEHRALRAAYIKGAASTSVAEVRADGKKLMPGIDEYMDDNGQ